MKIEKKYRDWNIVKLDDRYLGCIGSFVAWRWDKGHEGFIIEFRLVDAMDEIEGTTSNTIRRDGRMDWHGYLHECNPAHIPAFFVDLLQYFRAVFMEPGEWKDETWSDPAFNAEVWADFDREHNQ